VSKVFGVSQKSHLMLPPKQTAWLFGCGSSQNDRFFSTSCLTDLKLPLLIIFAVVSLFAEAKYTFLLEFRAGLKFVRKSLRRNAGVAVLGVPQVKCAYVCQEKD
jgi:hypothetical protein